MPLLTMNPAVIQQQLPMPGQMGVPMMDPRQWSTRIAQTSPPSTMGECCFSLWCLPISAAMAKSKVDNTYCCFNFLCFSPCSAAQFIRYEYGVAGVCGDDFCYGLMCSWCVVRRAATEARLRGGLPPHGGQYGADNMLWSTSLFDCSFCELCSACFCPFSTAHAVHTALQPAADSCCYDFFCTPPTAWYGQTRAMYGIVSDFPCLEDVVLPIFCFPCALNRAHKQASTPLPRIPYLPKQVM